MEIILSGMFIAKIFLLLFASLGLAFLCLNPINDQPTSKMQWAVWIVLEGILFAFMFGFISIKFVA